MRRLSFLFLCFTLTACMAATPVTKPFNFEKTGILTRNNPGLTPGIWYLIYEELGQADIPVRVSFDDESICIRNLSRGPCERSIFQKGMIVELKAMREAEGVRAVEMTIIKSGESEDSTGTGSMEQ